MFKLSQLAGFGSKSAAGAAYTPNLVESNTNNAYISGSGATALTAGQQEAWVFSAWVNFSTEGYFFSADGASGRVIGVRVNSTGVIFVFAGGTTIGANAQSSAAAAFSSGSFRHLLLSVDLSRPSADKIQVYVDDADVAMGTITVSSGSGALDGSWGFNAFATGVTQLITDAQSDFWFDLVAMDFDTTSERRKFIDVDGNQVKLGADGSNPNGSQPLWYWGGDAAAWNGGNHTGSDIKTFTSTNSYTDV